MAATAPPGVTAAPTPYPVRSDRTTFSARVDAFVTWLVAAIAQLVALASNVYNNALDAYASATEAAASEAAVLAAVGALTWVSGNNYVDGDGVYSPLDWQSYRCILDATGLTTDPSLDVTHWQILGTPNPSAIIMSYNLFGGL